MPISGNNSTTFITCGDPAGIGAEIVLKAVTQQIRRGKGPFVVVGSGSILRRAERLTGLKLPKSVSFVDLENVREKDFQFGKSSPSLGRAAYEYIEEATKRLQEKGEGCLVTAPIHKLSLKQAGFPWPGHTEMLQTLTHTKKVNMMFVGKHFCLSLATWHIPMRTLVSTLTSQKVLDAILLLQHALTHYFSKRQPLLALCGLNPHAGENGVLGNEEKTLLEPALRKAKRQGVRIVGPLPADSLFYEAYRKQYDGVVALYHDQGLIPFKMMERASGVNVTLGLPFIRTSPDHGTAYDIAGKNCASFQSMLEAIRVGQKMSRMAMKKEPNES